MVRLMARDYSRERRKVRTVRIGEHDLDKEIRGMLTMYASDITDAIDAAGAEMVNELVDITRKTAPRRHGDFYKAIMAKTIRRPSGNLYVWGVKSPLHRITHLLVHGHPTVNGDRVDGDPFLHNALDIVLPKYEETVKEAIKNAE
jgi:hypothetical protein